MPAPSFDPGSFRDRDGRVFVDGNRFYRALTRRAHADWTVLRGSRTWAYARAHGSIVETTEVPVDQVRLPPGDWHGVLAHDAIPFISYPYEWTFSMLRDAALLQLDLLLQALEDGLVLKDGSPFNVQFRGAKPTFIDLSSFTVLKPGEPWAGYRQFCCLCLNPLVLQSRTGVSFRPWLQGSLEGLSPADLTRLLPWRDRWQRGFFTHVYLHGRLQARYRSSTADIRGALRDSGLDRRVVRNTALALRRIISGLAPASTPSTWSDYASQHSYSDRAHGEKRAFVTRVLAARRRALVWDIGANTGEYARLAADSSDQVVALDADEGAVDRLYQSLQREGPRNILPLVLDIANPSPGLGWRERERKALRARGRPDLALCLALVHHLVIAANVPVAEVIEYLAELTPEIVIEFVDRGDPMVDRLLRHRDDVFADYSRQRFEEALADRFDVIERLALPGGLRYLYHARRRHDSPEAFG